MVTQIVNSDRRDSKIERPVNPCGPFWVAKIAEHESKLRAMSREAATSVRKHRFGKVDQRNPRLRETPQHLFGHHAVAGTHIENAADLGVARKTGSREHLLEQGPPFAITLEVAPDPIVHVIRRVSIVVTDVSFLLIRHNSLRSPEHSSEGLSDQFRSQTTRAFASLTGLRTLDPAVGGSPALPFTGCIPAVEHRNYNNIGNHVQRHRIYRCGQLLIRSVAPL
jgi:hypothetical protein